MPAAIVPKTDPLACQPPEWPEDLLGHIQDRVHAAGRKVVVLDDDPTGTQTVHGVPVLTTWSVDAIARELENRFPAFYILTNSRSLPASTACAIGSEIGANLKQACRRTSAPVEVISRSDSTLRGHFPGEVDALKDGLGVSTHPCLLIPFFLEGGRYTIDDIHYVADGNQLVPAASTPFARDAVFGYRHSNLRRWVEEKTGGRVPAEQVTSIMLDDLRRGGPSRVARQLTAMTPDSYGVVNAASYRDLEVLVAALTTFRLVKTTVSSPFLRRWSTARTARSISLLHRASSKRASTAISIVLTFPLSIRVFTCRVVWGTWEPTTNKPP
jgi:uncharacterized protein YgbK (DUF1537 family)